MLYLDLKVVPLYTHPEHVQVMVPALLIMCSDSCYIDGTNTEDNPKKSLVKSAAFRANVPCRGARLWVRGYPRLLVLDISTSQVRRAPNMWAHSDGELDLKRFRGLISDVREK